MWKGKEKNKRKSSAFFSQNVRKVSATENLGQRRTKGFGRGQTKREGVLLAGHAKQKKRTTGGKGEKVKSEPG